MELLKKYDKLEKEIHDYFGYVENWVVIPMDDNTEMFWFLDNVDEHASHVSYAKKKDDFPKDDYYVNSIYKQRFLPKWVYRGEDYTMVVVDTQTDGNKFLQIFNNRLEIKGVDLEAIEATM